jgi:hypothetical protein
VWWKRVTNQATERLKVVTAAGLTGSSCCGLSTYTGCELTGSPSDATPVTAVVNAGVNSSAGITTVTPGALVGLSHGYTDDAPAITADSVVATDPSSLTDRIRHISSGGSDSQVGHHSAVKASAGATGSITWAGTNDQGNSIAFALRPENSGSTVSTQADVALADPSGTLTSGTDTGQIRARFRKKGSGANPQGRIELRNASGSWSTTVIADTSVTESDADGQLVSGTFNQSIVTSKTDVVARFVGTGAAGGLAELVAVEWNSVTVAGATPSFVRDPYSLYRILSAR